MRQIPLTKGQFAIVDDSDYEQLSKYRWCAQKRDNTYHAARRQRLHEGGAYVYMHRQIMGVESSVEVDHRDGNGLNNQRRNLRVCTSANNNFAFQHKRANKTSQFRGVSLHRCGKWRASLQISCRQIHLGLFEDEVAAASAYDAGARIHFGEFAHLNFPS